jgi:hypothetical protein
VDSTGGSEAFHVPRYFFQFAAPEPTKTPSYKGVIDIAIDKPRAKISSQRKEVHGTGKKEPQKEE